jgi:hypothetical protein
LAYFIVKNSKDFIQECAEILKIDKIIKAEKLTDIINTKYPDILRLTIDK